MLYKVNIIVDRDQGLLVLNTNVTVSRNLYWSTLSALIAWPRPGLGPTRCDWIWKVPIQVMPTGYLFLHSSAAPARRKVSRIWSVPLHLCLSCPQLISSGRRARGLLSLCWRMWRSVSQNEMVMKNRWRFSAAPSFGRRVGCWWWWCVCGWGGGVVTCRCVCRTADMCICHCASWVMRLTIPQDAPFPPLTRCLNHRHHGMSLMSVWTDRWRSALPTLWWIQKQLQGYFSSILPIFLKQYLHLRPSRNVKE